MTNNCLRLLAFALITSLAGCKGPEALDPNRTKHSTRPRTQTGSNISRQATAERTESSAREKKRAEKKKKAAAKKTDEDFTPRSGFR